MTAALKKVPLIRPRPSDGWHNPNHSSSVVTFSLPFFKSKGGLYIHRVRSAQIHRWNGEYSHTSIKFWCGNQGSIGRADSRGMNGALFAEPPQGSIFCATCEGRAIGAGMDGAREICGRTVLYSPRV